MMSPQELEPLFGFHPATETTGPLHEEARAKCLELAKWINQNVPDSREKSIALTKVQEAMWASNAAIAIHTPRD